MSVADIKVHGKINEDSKCSLSPSHLRIPHVPLPHTAPPPPVHFGSFHLCSDNQHLLYIAEKKKEKTSSYFAKTDSSKEDPAPVKVRGEGGREDEVGVIIIIIGGGA